MKRKIIFYLRKIKSSFLWYCFIKYFIKPIYDWVWKYIINFQGRLLYILFHSHKDLNLRYNLNYAKNDKIIIENNSSLRRLSKTIFDNLKKKDLIKKSFERLSSGSYGKSLNKYKSGSNAYVDDLFEDLDETIRENIVNFAVNSEIYLSASKYLGVLPVVAKINVTHNIVNESKKPRASMLWHKDDFGYKSLDLFLAISDIDENNGPLEFIKKKNLLGIFYKIPSDLKEQGPGQRNKIEETQFSNYFNEQDFDKFLGKSGAALLIDSFTTYHRGGNCKLKNRLMLRISYQTPDAYSLSKKDKFIFSKHIKKKNTYNNILSKYSLSKRYGSNLSKKLLQFYRIFQYKANS